MKIRLKSICCVTVKVFLISGILLSSSCISQRRVKLLQDKATKIAPADYMNEKDISYRLQVGDYLYIEVYSVDPQTSRFFQTDFPDLMNTTYVYLKSYLIDESGYINFSFIDKMYVKGMTVLEVRDMIQEKVNEYFKETTVVVKMVNFEVSVVGEVSSPGSFTVYRDQINIFQAIGLAGGFKDFGNPKKVRLVRQTQTGSSMVQLDLSKSSILESPYFYLQPNDIVYVEPLNAKSWSYDHFPFDTIILLISTALVGYSILFD